MKRRILYLLCAAAFTALFAQAADKPSGKYTRLVFHDEFNGKGLPDTTRWDFEYGRVRNGEKQFYTAGRIENAYRNLLNYRNLVRYYTNKTISVSYLRARKKNDMDRVTALYGNPNEKYW